MGEDVSFRFSHSAATQSNQKPLFHSLIYAANSGCVLLQNYFSTITEIFTFLDYTQDWNTDSKKCLRKVSAKVI